MWYTEEGAVSPQHLLVWLLVWRTFKALRVVEKPYRGNIAPSIPLNTAIYPALCTAVRGGRESSVTGGTRLPTHTTRDQLPGCTSQYDNLCICAWLWHSISGGMFSQTMSTSSNYVCIEMKGLNEECHGWLHVLGLGDTRTLTHHLFGMCMSGLKWDEMRWESGVYMCVCVCVCACVCLCVCVCACVCVCVCDHWLPASFGTRDSWLSFTSSLRVKLWTTPT